MTIRPTSACIILAIGLLIFFRCENEVLENAASIECSFRLDGLQAVDDKLLIEKSYLQVASAKIHGLRNEAETFNTSRDFTSGQGVVLLNGDDPFQPMSIPVPSGNYTDVTVSLVLHQDDYTLVLKDTIYIDLPGRNANNGHKDNEYNGTTTGRNTGRSGKTVDLAHFLKYARPSMMLQGEYTNDTETIRIVIALNLKDKILFTKDNTDPDTLLLTKNSTHTALASFNTSVMLQSLTPTKVETSELISFQGQRVLFIHEDFNTELFTTISGNIQACAKLKID